MKRRARVFWPGWGREDRAGLRSSFPPVLIIYLRAGLSGPPGPPPPAAGCQAPAACGTTVTQVSGPGGPEQGCQGLRPPRSPPAPAKAVGAILRGSCPCQLSRTCPGTPQASQGSSDLDRKTSDAPGRQDRTMVKPWAASSVRRAITLLS